MQNPTEKLSTIGFVLGLLLVIVIIQLVMVLNSVAVFDGHGQSNMALMEEKLDRQIEALNTINNQLQRMQDQQRGADDMRLTLREGFVELGEKLQRAAPAQTPVYVPMPVGAQAPAPAPAPAATPAPAPAATPAPAEPQDEPVAEGPGETEPANVGEGTAAAGDLGIEGDQERVPGPDTNGVVGGTYIQTATEPSTFNYYTTTEGRTTSLLKNHILDSMFRVSEQDPTKLMPYLAVKWDVSDDKLSYTFHLRPNVLWSDGAPFSADDVLFSFGVIRDETVKAEGTRGEFLDVDTVEKIDNLTVKVTFKRKYWKALYVFGNSLQVIPKHWYQVRVQQVAAKKGIEAGSEPGEPGFGECFNEVQEPPVGTGPYTLTDWDRGTSLTMVRNDKCWRLRAEPGSWNIKATKYRFISDHTQLLNQARQQKVDVVVVKKDEWLDSLRHEKAIKDNYDYYNYDHVGLGYNFIAWNCRKFPFDDARVRRAMTHLVDRAGLLRDLWRNNGVVATCMNKRIYPEYNTDLEPLAFSPEKAAALLREAGFSDTDGDGVLDKEVQVDTDEDGTPDTTMRRPFRFVFKIPSGISEYEKVGSRMKDAMKAVGVEMTIHPLEWATFIEDYYNHKFDGICLYNSFPDVWIDPYEAVHSSEDKPRGGNGPGLRMPEIDQLVEAARQEFDREKRIELYHRLYEILHEQQPRTLLIHGRVNVLLHKRFRNVVVRHSGMRHTYWWVDPKDEKY